MAAARFKVTGTGKLRRMKGNRSHLKRKKSARVKRQFSDSLVVSKGDEKRIKRLLVV